MRAARAPRSRRTWAALLALALLGLAYSAWIEPKLLLFRDHPVLRIGSGGLRIAHLTDLHVRGDSPLLHRLAREVAASRPDLIVISGDLIHDVPEGPEAERIAAATAAFLAALRHSAPVYLIQGHSEHQGSLIPRFARTGAEWLSNEGRRIGPRGEVLLLGLNQQLGVDLGGWGFPSPFQAIDTGAGRYYGARRGFPYRNFYSHYDPHPASLASAAGPLSWSSYDTTCEVWIDDPETAAGIAVHSRHVLGEDRMIELHRDPSRWSRRRGFRLFLHGSDFTGGSRDHLDTGVDPVARRWYRLRLRTEVDPNRVWMLAKAWPVGRAEPERWQAWGEDRSAFRPTAGTVGLWAAGGGGVAYRNLRVVDRRGALLLATPLVATGRETPAGRPPAATPDGFRVGLRGTRLALALARSPRVAAGTPRIVLAHVPDVALEASRAGIEAVLAGHTHGGQIRLPFYGPLTTRCALGPYYARGLFYFAAPNSTGLTALYVNAGFGMSVLPLRFGCPPRWGLVDLR